MARRCLGNMVHEASQQECISIIYRHGKTMHDRAMKQFGLSGIQMRYLKFIHDNLGISQEELAEIFKIDKGAVAKAIKDMVNKGYVRKTQNPADRRAYCLYPTEKAEEIHKEGEQHRREFEKKLTEGLSEEEIETFMILLDKITQNMKKMMGGGNI